MSFAEEQLVALLERKPDGRIMSMSGPCTGSMWIGLNTIGGPFMSTRRASEIIRAVLYVTGITYNDFLSHRRARHIAEARQIAYWFMRHYTRLSTTQIGHFVGNRDHATVLHGVKRVSDQPGLFLDRINAAAQVLMVTPPIKVSPQ